MRCRTCNKLTSEVAWAASDLWTARRKLRAWGAKAGKTLSKVVLEAEDRLHENEVKLAEHQADCPAAHETKHRRILDVRHPKPKPEPKAPRSIIDRDALDAALAEMDAKSGPMTLLADRRPERKTTSGQYVRTTVTGRCHECDRPVSGERRFCGPCLARRI